MLGYCFKEDIPGPMYAYIPPSLPPSLAPYFSALPFSIFGYETKVSVSGFALGPPPPRTPPSVNTALPSISYLAVMVNLAAVSRCLRRPSGSHVKR